MRAQPGMLLLVLVLTVSYLVAYSREAFHDGGPPAFFVEDRGGVTVMLRDGFPHPGIHQFYDGITPKDVIKMTAPLSSLESSEGYTDERALLSGEVLDITLPDTENPVIEREWMIASQRMALDIPLHPDRMTLQDWQALPGIGPRLADRIMTDRQQNGDFGSLEDLDRVHGIGPGRLASWQSFF